MTRAAVPPATGATGVGGVGLVAVGLICQEVGASLGGVLALMNGLFYLERAGVTADVPPTP